MMTFCSLMFNLRMSDAAATKPHILSPAKIDKLLSKTPIANLAHLTTMEVFISCQCGSCIGNDITDLSSHAQVVEPASVLLRLFCLV